MKGKVLKIIGITGLFIFTAGFATAKYLEAKSKRFQDDEIAEDPNFDEITGIIVQAKKKEDGFVIDSNYSIQRLETGDDFATLTRTQKHGTYTRSGFNVCHHLSAKTRMITELNMQYIYELLTFYPLEYVSQEEGWDVCFETKAGKFYVIAPDNFSAILEELDNFFED